LTPPPVVVFFVARRFSDPHLRRFTAFCGVRHFAAVCGSFWCFAAVSGVGHKFPLRDQTFGGAQTPAPFWGSGALSPLKTFFLVSSW